ncbi:amidohydrolase family protein [Sphingomonas sp. YL-JM2C]
MDETEGAGEVDLLITAGCIVTVDAERRIIHDGAIAVRGSDIVAVGPRDVILRGHRAGRTIDAPDGLVTPGLIDAHNHPVDYLIKGLCDDTPQMVRLRDRVIPYEDGLTEEEAYASSLGTFVEMIRLGTTCFVDAAGPRPSAIARAALDLGLRGIVTRKMADVPGPFGGVTEDSERAMNLAEETVERFHGAGGGLLRAGYDIDLPPVVSDRAAAFVRDRAAARDTTIVSHLIGRRAPPGEPEAARNADVERLERLGLLGPRMILAHIGWLPEGDVELLARSGTNIAHCPAASLVGGNGWAVHGVIADLAAAGANVVLGTDAAAISRFMDMVRIMQLTAGIHKESRRDPLIMNPHRVFEMATISAARAIGWRDRIGSIEAGKAADLVIFDTGNPHWWPDPFGNPVPDLVYGGSGRDARTVLVNGHVVMEDGVIAGADLRDIGGMVRRAAASCRARLGMAPSGRWPD